MALQNQLLAPHERIKKSLQVDVHINTLFLHHLVIFAVDVEDLFHPLLAFLIERVGTGPVGATGSTEPATAKVKDVHQVLDHPTTETPAWG